MIIQGIRRTGFIANVFLVALMSTNSLPASAPDATSPNVAAVADSSNQFALDLYAKLGAANGGNLFFSPQSISTALAMTYTGARDETAKQMAGVLHLNVAPDQLASAQAALVEQLNEAGKKGLYQLTVANRLWGQQGYKYLDGFLKTLHDDYHAELEQLDFSADPEQARQSINTWVEQATNDKITNLMPPGSVDTTTKLVLTNAVYFKGNWLNQFDKQRTKQAPFFLSAVGKVDVPLMYQKENYQYGEATGSGELNLKVLQIPYKGNDLSMVLLLPEKVDGLAALDKQLTVDNLKNWTAKLGRHEVRVWLPKFKLTEEFQLADTLSGMGMPLAFSPEKADFSGIDGKRDLALSAVIHKAYVDVNEEGTEAAAATGVGMVAMARPMQKVAEFRADHPFVFLIRDNKSGCILFLGRVADPQGSEAK